MLSSTLVLVIYILITYFFVSALCEKDLYCTGAIIGLSLIHDGPVPAFLSALALEAIVHGVCHVYGHSDMNAHTMQDLGVISMDEYIAWCSVSCW